MAAIDAMAKTVKANFFGFKLLQGLVGRHMYMFALPVQERQRLAEAVGIDLRTQLATEVRSNVKKLPGVGRQPAHPKSLLGRLHRSFLFHNQKSVEDVLARNVKTGEDSGET